jgi:hypothetical protein
MKRKKKSQKKRRFLGLKKPERGRWRHIEHYYAPRGQESAVYEIGKPWTHGVLYSNYRNLDLAFDHAQDFYGEMLNSGSWEKFENWMKDEETPVPPVKIERFEENL